METAGQGIKEVRRREKGMRMDEKKTEREPGRGGDTFIIMFSRFLQ